MEKRWKVETWVDIEHNGIKMYANVIAHKSIERDGEDADGNRGWDVTVVDDIEIAKVIDADTGDTIKRSEMEDWEVLRGKIFDAAYEAREA